MSTRGLGLGVIGSCLRPAFLRLGIYLVFLNACDPNDKIVRSTPDKPLPAAAGDDRKSDSNQNRDVSPGDLQGPRGQEVDGTEQPRDQGTAGVEGGSQDQGYDGGAVAPGSSTGVSSSQENEDMEAHRREAESLCSELNPGACFVAARAVIQADPDKAIQFYLKACVPTDPLKGDGLACRAAAVLEEASGSQLKAKNYYEAACRKAKDPVNTVCQKN